MALLNMRLSGPSCLCWLTTDLILAVNSVSAIFAVTKDAFLIYTSNVFPIMRTLGSCSPE
jgi:hypothetical protein